MFLLCGFNSHKLAGGLKNSNTMFSLFTVFVFSCLARTRPIFGSHTPTHTGLESFWRWASFHLIETVLWLFLPVCCDPGRCVMTNLGS